MRRVSPQVLLPVVLLVALPLLLLAPALAPGRALLGVSTAQLSPWRETQPPERLAELQRESLTLTADKVLMFQPQLELARRRLLEGEAPLWNPQALCGVPLLAQAVHGVLSPPLLLLAPLGPTRSWALLAALQIALAGLFMYLLAREYGLCRVPATLAGLGFAWCGFLAVRLEWYQIQGASVWLPAALLAVERAFRGARAGAVLLLGVALGCSLLAGFPQSSVFIAFSAALLAAVRLAAALRDRAARAAGTRAAATCAAGVLLGLLLGAPQLLPSAELAASPDSTRRAAPPEALAAHALDPAGLLAAVVPDLFGHPRDLARHALPQLREAGVLRQIFCRPGSNWVETSCSFGLPPLLLALLGLGARRRGARVAGALCVAGALLAVQTPLLPWVLRVPGLDAGDPRRFLLLFGAGGALLAGFGLQRVLDEGPRRWHLALLAGVAGLLLLGFGAAALTDADRWTAAVAPRLAQRAGLPLAEVQAHAGDLQLDLELLRAALRRAALLAALTWVGLLLARRRRALAAAALLALAGADLLSFAARARSVLPAEGHFAEPPGLSALRDPAGGRVARFVTTDPKAVLAYPLPPNTGLPFGVRDLSGYITLAPRRVEALHERLQPGTASGVGVAALTDPAALDSALLDVFSVSRILANVPVEREGLTELGRLGDAWLYANDSVLPRARLVARVRLVGSEAEAAAALDDPALDLRAEAVVEARGDAGFEAAAAADGDPGVARLVVDEPERLVVDVAVRRPAVLVVADSFLPGWEAFVDGQPAPVHAADLAFRAVALPAGAQRVEMLYRPAGWRAGRLAGAAGLLGLLLAGGLALRARGRAASAPD